MGEPAFESWSVWVQNPCSFLYVGKNSVMRTAMLICVSLMGLSFSFQKKFIQTEKVDIVNYEHDYCHGDLQGLTEHMPTLEFV